MSVTNGLEIDPSIDPVTWPDRIGAGVSIVAAVGNVAVLATGAVDPATSSGKAILPGGVVGTVLGIPGLIKIEQHQRQKAGI